jgi:glycerophosphoryl diester phosphodiesterase
MKLTLLIVLVIICTAGLAQHEVKIAGHRGYRGLYPENSIIGFQKAVACGTNAIEFDVVVNKDKQLVVSHEPFIDRTYCWNEDSSSIQNQKSLSIYNMTQEEVAQYDCGSKPHPQFSEQLKLSSSKPLLKTVFDSVDFANVTLLFEIKYKFGDTVNYPSVNTYAQIVLNEANASKYKNQIVFMSFDASILNQIHSLDATFKMVYLVYQPKVNVLSFLDDLNFEPFAMGMFFPTIRKRKVQVLFKKGIKTFAWTVNSQKKAQQLANMGVDVLITDFPELLIQKIKNP